MSILKFHVYIEVPEEKDQAEEKERLMQDISATLFNSLEYRYSVGVEQ